MDLDHPEEHKEKVARHRRLHPQPWHAFLHEGRVLQLGQGKLDAEVGGSVLHVVLHPRCRGLWPQHRPGVRRSQRERAHCCIHANMWRRKRKICHRGRDLPFFPKRRNPSLNPSKNGRAEALDESILVHHHHPKQTQSQQQK